MVEKVKALRKPPTLDLKFLQNESLVIKRQLDVRHLEIYLPEEVFEKEFGVTFSVFRKKSDWEQLQMKKSLSLVPPVCAHLLSLYFSEPVDSEGKKD